MKNLINLYEDVFDNGNHRGDRTGTGTQSVFGRQMRFDLKKGFPAVTTKKLAVKSVFSELLWFLEGSSDSKRLSEILRGKREGFTIWDDNGSAPYWKDKAKFEGDLGRIYGQQWRFTKQYLKNINYSGIRDLIDSEEPFGVAPEPNHFKGWYSDVLPYKGIDIKLLELWKDMIEAESKDEVVVAKRWLNFECFKEDVKKLEGWKFKENFWDEYGLTNLFHKSIIFSRYTTRWLDMRNIEMLSFGEGIQAAKGKFLVEGLDPKDLMISLPFLTEETILKHLESGEEIEGWKLTRSEDVQKYIRLDQVDELIKGLKIDPFSRRHIVNGWNPAEFEDMALPPCHAMFQFYVREEGNKKYLSCHLYQRSVDTFLGLPFNIASYALLTHMVAMVCGFEVDEFVWTGGDVHIYNDHVEQVQEQITREPMKLTQLKIKRKVDRLEDFTMDDFELVDYVHHEPLTGNMAV